MSFSPHDGRKRQSAHAAKSEPPASIESDGREMARIGALLADMRFETVVRVNVAPPSVERRLSIVPVSACSPA